MDFQNRNGVKFGGGALASASMTNEDRIKRQRKLVLEATDLSKDPYIFKNHLGRLECRLCCTEVNNEASYIAHAAGKRHQTNILKRRTIDPQKLDENPTLYPVKKQETKNIKHQELNLARPGYNAVKIRQPNGQKEIIFEIDYPNVKGSITEKLKPQHRIMTCFEQEVEVIDHRYQYLIVGCQNFENIAFKIPNLKISNIDESWIQVNKKYKIHITFKLEEKYAKQKRPRG